MKGANGQSLDGNVLKSKGSSWIVQPDSGETIDGGTWSNCTLWDPGDTDLNGTPDDPNIDSFVWNIPAGDTSGFIANGVTLDGSGRDAMRITNASNAILNGMVITGTNASATGIGVHVIRTNNANTLLTIAGGTIQGSHETGIKINARVGGAITGVLIAPSSTNATSVHVDNPSDTSGRTALTISSNTITRGGTGEGILVEKTGTGIGSRTCVAPCTDMGEGAVTISGNGSNETIFDWINIAATYVGEYAISGNMRTGDRASNDAQVAASTFLGYIRNGIVITDADCDGPRAVRMSIPGVGLVRMQICDDTD